MLLALSTPKPLKVRPLTLSALISLPSSSTLTMEAADLRASSITVLMPPLATANQLRMGASPDTLAYVSVTGILALASAGSVNSLDTSVEALVLN
ncbi:hypothetical protein D3C75_1199020 [compost metagenome]